MFKLTGLSFLSMLMFWGAALSTQMVQAQSRMTCKLESQRVIQVKERQCIYRCPDGSIEGRTRRVNQECLRTVVAANE